MRSFPPVLRFLINPDCRIVRELDHRQIARKREKSLKTSMQKIPHVALIIEISGVYGRQLIEGINQYLQEHRPWSMTPNATTSLPGDPT
jgi:hypothetical protein